MNIPTYTPSKVTITIEENGRVTTYTFPSVGTATFNIKEFPFTNISDTITVFTPTRGIESVTLELTDILRDENQTQLIVEAHAKMYDSGGTTDLTITDDMVLAGAKALVFEESSGLCEFGRVCPMCDCYAVEDDGKMKDGYALSHARAVLEAALNKEKL